MSEWVAEGELTLPIFGEQFTSVGSEYLDLFLQDFQYKNVRLTVKVELLDDSR